MGEKVYRIERTLISFSTADDDLFSCLCTFPHNNEDGKGGGEITAEDVADLAIFGAAVRLVFAGRFGADEIYLPHGMPAWIVDGIRNVLKKAEEE